jgi:hypothetical protein
MLLRKNTFFILLAFILISPPYIHRLFWLSASVKTTGIVWFEGHTMDIKGGVTSHPVIMFYIQEDRVHFNAPGYLNVKPGDKVSVFYKKSKPADAMVNHPLVWLGNIGFFYIPLLVLVVLCFTPERFDPLIPKGASIRIGLRPLIKIVRNK